MPFPPLRHYRVLLMYWFIFTFSVGIFVFDCSIWKITVDICMEWTMEWIMEWVIAWIIQRWVTVRLSPTLNFWRYVQFFVNQFEDHSGHGGHDGHGDHGGHGDSGGHMGHMMDMTVATFIPISLHFLLDSC